MKTLSLIFFTLAFTAHAEVDICETHAVPEILEDSQISSLVKVSDKLKQDFKRRANPKKGYLLALNFETNFEAPIVGSDLYWGRIYLNDGDPTKISYRDELAADEHYKKEVADPSKFYMGKYSISSINSDKGLPLIDAGGASVNVKSVGTDFSTKTGGRLSLKVKAPSTALMNITMDVKRSGNQISKTLVMAGKSVPFDSFKINAKSGLFGVSILNGVSNVQFFKNGKVVHTLNP